MHYTSNYYFSNYIYDDYRRSFKTYINNSRWLGYFWEWVIMGWNQSTRMNPTCQVGDHVTILLILIMKKNNIYRTPYVIRITPKTLNNRVWYERTLQSKEKNQNVHINQKYINIHGNQWRHFEDNTMYFGNYKHQRNKALRLFRLALKLSLRKTCAISKA